MIKGKPAHIFKIVVLMAVISTILFSAILVFQNKLPSFRLFDPNELPQLIRNETTTIGQKTGQFLWEYRVLDLIAQAFVLFATAVCCVILLKAEKSL